MADARKRAEEALAEVTAADLECSSTPTVECVLALRDLLAALDAPAPYDGHGETYDEVWRDRERLRERLDAIESWGIENPGDIMRVADAWRAKVEAAEAERDSLRARLRELEHIGTGAARSAMPNADEGHE